MAGTRPGGVTVVAILAWIAGLLQVITGALVLFSVPATAAIAFAAWAAISFGVITILVGGGLWSGSALARIVATAVFVLDVANAVIAMFTLPPANAWAASVSGLIALIGIFLLWTKQASDYFRR